MPKLYQSVKWAEYPLNYKSSHESIPGSSLILDGSRQSELAKVFSFHTFEFTKMSTGAA